MASPTRPPWQFNVQNPDTQLPWDPNMPYADPAIGDQRQPVLQAQQSFQDAVQGQQQASQPSGLAGVFSSPLFQAAVPTALTALSAIFPRHMAIAGPVGMAGYRTLEDQNQFQQAQRQSVAANTAKQAQGNFDQQRFKYAVSHNYGLDPAIADSVFEAYKSDPKKGAEELQKAIVMQKQHDAAKGAASSPPTNLPIGGKETFKDPYGPESTFSGPPEMTGDLGALRAQFPDLNAVDLIKKRDELKPKTLAEQDQEDWLKRNPGKTAMDYTSAKSIAGEAGPMALKASEDATKRTKRGKLLVALGNAEFPMMSMARSPDMMADMADANDEREKAGLPRINLTERLAQQTAAFDRLKSLQGGRDHDTIMAATTMIPTLDRMEQLYDKIAPLMTDVPIVNSATLAAKYNLTGNEDIKKFEVALNEARQRNQLFINNGFAPTGSAIQASSEMLDKGFPPGALHGAASVIRMNAKDIVQAAVSNPVYGIDQNAPILKTLQIGPNAPEVNLEPASRPGGKPTTQGGPVTGKYKSLSELEDAVRAKKISPQAGARIMKANHWEANAR